MDEQEIEYPCLKCGADTQTNGGHAFWVSDGGVCDRCAEEYGCECGCFPPPYLSLNYEYDELERVDQVRLAHRAVTIPEHVEMIWEDDPGMYEEPRVVGAQIVPEKTYIVTYLEEREIWRVREDLDD